MFEEPVTPYQPAFSRGEVSPFLFGRVDLQAYNSSLRTSRNGFVHTEGSWSNRPGTQYCANSVTNTAYGSVLIPFTFNVGQTYVLELGNLSINLFSQGALINTGTTPYLTADLALLRYSQSADTLTIVHPKYPPYEFKRTSATTFTFLPAVYINGPFLQQNTDGVTFVYATGNTGFVSLFSNGPIFNANQVGGEIKLAQQDLSQITPWESVKELGNAGIAPLVQAPTYCRANGINYKLVGIPNVATGATTIATGTFEPNWQQGVQSDGTGNAIPSGPNCSGVNWQYTDSGYGTVLITQYISPTQVAGIVQPNYVGGPGLMPIAVIGGPQVASGISGNPWSFTGTGSQTSFSISGATATDPSKYYVTIGATLTVTGASGNGVNVTFNFASNATLSPTVGTNIVVSGVTPSAYNGTYKVTASSATSVTVTSTTTAAFVSGGSLKSAVYQAPSTYSITAGLNIVFGSAPANGASISVTQITSLSQTTYWSFDAFSVDQGYPQSVTYYPDRLVLAGTPQQPVGLFGSKTSAYHDFGQSTPIVNSDGFSIFLNARQLNAISDLVPLNDIIVDTSNIIWRLWTGVNTSQSTLGPLSIAANPQAFLGASPNCAGVLYGDSMIYATYGGRRIRDLIYQFQFDKYTGGELTAYCRHMVPFGVQIIKMQYAPEPWSTLFALRSDGILLACTYVRDQQMTAFSRWDSTNGVIEDIAVVPENNSYALYVIANRNINGASARYVERLAQWETSTIYDYNLVDCSLKYDGRNTSTTTMFLKGGTTWLSGGVGTLTASSTSGWANFASTDPTYNNVIQLWDSAGNLSRVLITAYISPTQVSVRFIDPIQADLQSTPILTWTFARTYFTGATQLANQTIMVCADANAFCGALGVPNITVSATGTFTLPVACGVVTAGIQYFSDFETMHMNQQGVQTIRERSKEIPALYLDVYSTRGLLAGTDFTNLSDFAERAFESYNTPTKLQNGIIAQILYSSMDSECHICIRQPYPLPCTIRMTVPDVAVGDKVG